MTVRTEIVYHNAEYKLNLNVPISFLKFLSGVIMPAFTYISWAVAVLIPFVQSTPTSEPSGRYLIGFNEGVNAAEHVQWARDLHERNFVKRFDRKPTSDGVETVFRRINAYVGHFDVETIEELKTSPDVRTIKSLHSHSCANRFLGCLCGA